ncbi:MAG TPA: hypothetical protein VFX52_06450 [Nocardioidaceae bacterium]|jgi:hypothetical protein|nr:hypothetical protein [Nocardioidaceae bacterium]
MYNDSVLYTVGTALNRAQQNGATVEVLVEGQWLSGQVAAVDGHGVVLAADDLEHPERSEHAVIRMGSVSAVRMFAAAPGHAAPASHPSLTPGGAAMPMPSSYTTAG